MSSFYSELVYGKRIGRDELSARFPSQEWRVENSTRQLQNRVQPRFHFIAVLPHFIALVCTQLTYWGHKCKPQTNALSRYCLAWGPVFYIQKTEYGECIKSRARTFVGHPWWFPNLALSRKFILKNMNSLILSTWKTTKLEFTDVWKSEFFFFFLVDKPLMYCWWPAMSRNHGYSNFLCSLQKY